MIAARRLPVSAAHSVSPSVLSMPPYADQFDGARRQAVGEAAPSRARHGIDLSTARAVVRAGVDAVDLPAIGDTDLDRLQG